MGGGVGERAVGGIGGRRRKEGNSRGKNRGRVTIEASSETRGGGTISAKATAKRDGRDRRQQRWAKPPRCPKVRNFQVHPTVLRPLNSDSPFPFFPPLLSSQPLENLRISLMKDNEGKIEFPRKRHLERRSRRSVVSAPRSSRSSSPEAYSFLRGASNQRSTSFVPPSCLAKPLGLPKSSAPAEL